MGMPLKHRLCLWPVWLVCEDYTQEQIEVLLAQVPEDTSRQIELDVPRTQPMLLGDEGCMTLRRVLNAFAVVRPDIGYCQGLNYMAAVFLFLGFCETKALGALNTLVRRYCPDY